MTSPAPSPSLCCLAATITELPETCVPEPCAACGTAAPDALDAPDTPDTLGTLEADGTAPESCVALGAPAASCAPVMLAELVSRFSRRSSDRMSAAFW